MTIGTKIAISCAALTAMTGILGIESLVGIHRMGASMRATVDDALPGIFQCSRAELLAKEMRNRMVLHLSASGEQKAGFEAEIASFAEQFKGIVREYQKSVFRQSERELFEKIEPAFNRYVLAWEPVRDLSRQLKQSEAMTAYQTRLAPAIAELLNSVQADVDNNKAYADECAATLAAAASGSNWWTWTILLISLVGGVALNVVISRGVHKTLRQSVDELSEGAEQVAGAAGQVCSASQALAQGASQQAGSLQETSASTQQISSMTHQNADNSRKAADSMARAEQRVQEANRTLEQMVSSMSEINDSSQKISKIIKVIDEIAFQTNILALNAAVEAARAGDAGMGFAVVADEVRNLAQRSAQAAKDTAALIEESVAKSTEGSSKLNGVADAIRGITEETVHAKTLVDEVTAASAEQSRGMEQISKAISEMEHVTQRTAASSEESASAGEELSAQAQAVKEVTRKLRGLIEREKQYAKGSSPVQTARVRPREIAKPIVRASAAPAKHAPPPARQPRTAVAEDAFPLDDSSFREL